MNKLLKKILSWKTLKKILFWKKREVKQENYQMFLTKLEKFDNLPVAIFISKELKIFAEFDTSKYSSGEVIKEIQRIINYG